MLRLDRLKSFQIRQNIYILISPLICSKFGCDWFRTGGGGGSPIDIVGLAGEDRLAAPDRTLDPEDRDQDRKEDKVYIEEYWGQ